MKFFAKLRRRLPDGGGGVDDGGQVALRDAAPEIPVEDVVPQLNPNLDRARLAEAFARTGRVHVANVLTDASARRVHYALERETPWRLMFNEGLKVHELSSVSPEDHQEMAIAAWERAHSHFQYFFHLYRLLEDRKLYPDPGSYLHKLVAFMTSADFLAFTREITGQDSIAWISGTATLYKPLDFLTIHDDSTADDRRLVAYVLNMTPEWKPDWGGALQFYDNRDHIEEGYLPTFNALNLFKVPKLHSVNQVSAFGGLRYSISGWLERQL